MPPAIRQSAGVLFPVGRLDRESEGLIILTSDGGWAERVLHPRYGVEREYAVGLETWLAADQLRALRAGVALDEGTATLRDLRTATPTEVRRMVELLRPGPLRLAWYRATLETGWRRQMRRMFAAVGAPVTRLVRVRIGPVRLDGLPAGALRPLTAREVEVLGAGRPAGGRSAAYPAGVDRGRRLVVALDGPASSGKSSVGAAAAAALGYRFCDTGLLYRALTWLALRAAIDPEDEAALLKLVDDFELAPDAGGRLARVRVGGRDVTRAVRSGRVDRLVSEVSRHPAVRAALVPRQRQLASDGGIIMAGRDIGTVILPEADLKLYLDASVAERARRRSRERGLDPDSPEGRRILEELQHRDTIDSERPVAPLRRAADAWVIDTDSLDFEATVKAVLAAIRERAGEAPR